MLEIPNFLQFLTFVSIARFWAKRQIIAQFPRLLRNISKKIKNQKSGNLKPIKPIYNWPKCWNFIMVFRGIEILQNGFKVKFLQEIKMR